METLLGAIYLESGTDACWQCVMRWYKSRIDELSLEKETPKDAKSRLQEWLPLFRFGVLWLIHRLEN
jgi:ribonuclease-3